MATKGEVFLPGTVVPVSGIYQVMHDRLDGDHHAQIHNVIAVAGARFPVCRGCGDAVTFLLYQREEHASENEHFSGEPLIID